MVAGGPDHFPDQRAHRRGQRPQPPDDDAPVSDLYLFGRKQDLAFERPIGDNPRKRHHVRFWRWDELKDGRPVWFGAATLDERVGLSYTTGQVTHHIGPDVDAERALIASTLGAAGYVLEDEWVNGFHEQLEGRNGGGDRLAHRWASRDPAAAGSADR